MRKNIISDCIIDRELPGGLELNRKTCEITGITTLPRERDNYLISPKNGAGRGNSVSISIEVVDCSTEQKVSYSITYFTGPTPTQVMWQLMTNDNILVKENSQHDYGQPGMEYFIGGCAPDSTYKFIMTNPVEPASPWPEGAYVTISISGMSPFTFRKTTSDQQQTELITCKKNRLRF